MPFDDGGGWGRGPKRPHQYILEGRRPVPEWDLHKWAVWFGTHDRHVARTMVHGVQVSTIFLGLDHSFMDGPPILFETMVFGGALTDEQERYSTWDEAELGHRLMRERVKRASRKPSAEHYWKKARAELRKASDALRAPEEDRGLCDNGDAE